MRFFLYHMLLTIILVRVSAQEVPDETVLLQQIHEGQYALEVPKIKSSPAKWYNFGFQAGSSMTMPGNSKALFSSYLSPEIRFHISPRFQLNTGVVYSQQYLPFAREGLTSAAGTRFDRFLVFVEGQYSLNERIWLSGLVMKEMGISDPRINAFQKNTSFQFMDMGIHYKVTDNLHFGAQIRVSDGHPLFYSNPYNRNPFRNSSFFTPDVWW